MFKAEARWLRDQVLSFAPDDVSPLLNIGSSTKHFREIEQPWNETELFAPLRARGIRVIHADFRDGDGIDIRADILSDADLPRLKALNAKAVLCCNILEHVLEPAKLARRCMDIVGRDGLVFVTVPRSYRITAIRSTRCSGRRRKSSPRCSSRRKCCMAKSSTLASRIAIR